MKKREIVKKEKRNQKKKDREKVPVANRHQLCVYIFCDTCNVHIPHASFCKTSNDIIALNGILLICV